MSENRKNSKGSTYIGLLVIVSLLLVSTIIYFFVIVPKDKGTKTPEATAVATENVDTKAASQTEKPTAEETEPPIVKEEIIQTEAPRKEPELINLSSSRSGEALETIGSLVYEDAQEIPEIYNAGSYVGIDKPFWVFMDDDGIIQIRTYGTRWKKKNNVNQEKITGFFAAEIKHRGNNVPYLEVTSATAVQADKENPIQLVRSQAAPDIQLNEEKYHMIAENLYACVSKTGNYGYRTFANIDDLTFMYACDKNGNIAPGSLPIEYEEEVYNLAPYTEGMPATATEYGYPVKYNKANITLTIEQ